MPDVNTLTIAELWEHANYYVGAVRTDDPTNLTHNAQMLANLVERLSEQVSHFRPATSKIPWDDEPADNPDSVKLRLTRDLADAVAQRAAGAHPATYLLGRLNEPGISWDDDWNLTAWDYDPTDPQKHIVVTEADLAASSPTKKPSSASTAPDCKTEHHLEDS
jgi:hypothetical protein